MRVFEKFAEGQKCPICGTDEDKECVLIGISGTQEGHNIQARCYHLECIELTEEDYQGRTFIAQSFVRKDG